MKIANISYGNDIKQRWTADTLEELEAAFAREKACYPTTGYGTSMYDVKQTETGEWKAIFYRFHCCD